MPQPLRVAPSQLDASGRLVDAHADALHAQVRVVLTEVEAALAGAPAQSQMALSKAAAKWETDHLILLSRLLRFGEELQKFASRVVSTEVANVEPFLNASVSLDDVVP